MNTKKVALSMVTFLTASYLLCVLAGFVLPAEFGMHHLLETVLPGFEWLNLGTFFIGLFASILWGVYLGIGFSVIYNAFNKTNG
jgi:hypothetical protein